MPSDVSGAGAEPERWPHLLAELRRRLGPGAPLPAPMRAPFAGQLGGNLSRAMVHHRPVDPSPPRAVVRPGKELAQPVQRSDASAGADTSEPAAHLIQREIDSDSPAPPAQRAVDPDKLAERVYRRMLTELWRERERGAWII